MKIPRAWHGGLSMAAAARVSVLWLCGVASSSLGSTNAVSICPYPEGKPSAVAFTFDDGIVKHDLVGAVELEKRGWRGTFNIIASAPGTRSISRCRLAKSADRMLGMTRVGLGTPRL